MADQAYQHKAALKTVKDSEAALLAKFETECSDCAEREKALSDSYGEIEDMLVGELSFSFHLLTVI